MAERTDRPRTRRANGAGSVTTRADGALVLRVTDASTGLRTKRIVPRSTRSDGRPETPAAHRKRAEAVLASLRAEVARPATLREAWTVKSYAEERWLPCLEGRAASTVEGYRNITRLYLEPAVGDVALIALTVDHVDDLDRGLRERGLSVTTRRHARGTLTRLLRHAKRKGRVTQVVTEDANPIPPDDRDRTKDVLERNEVRALLAASKGTPWEAPVALLSLLGLRRGEVLGLCWDCLDLEAGRLTVARNLVPLCGGRVHLGLPKSRGSMRTVELVPAIVALLRAQRARQAEDRLAAGPMWVPEPIDATGAPVALVFTDEAGRPLPPWRLTGAVTRLAAEAGITRHVHPHALRHGYASLLLAEGHDIAAIAVALGHASPAITASTYSHAMRRQRVAATAAMADAIGGAW